MDTQIKINPQKLKENQEVPLLALDFIMLVLISVNLTWMAFDALFSTDIVRNGLAAIVPEFSTFYGDKVHPNFAVIDLVFIAIFLVEIGFRWLRAIILKTHHRWFFYPFIHWYDVLGCLPSPVFRLLRLLRLVSIVSRLQRHGVIDLSNSWLYRTIRKYYNIVMEEVSDRVVINVLSGVQDEIRHGSPISDQILHSIVLPRKAMIAEWLSERINLALETVYEPRRPHLKAYIEEIVAEGIAEDPAVKQLHRVPMVGEPVAQSVENMVGNIVYRVVDRVVTDIGHESSDDLLAEMSDNIIDRLLEPSDKFSGDTRQIVIDALDIYKERLAVQRWKLKEW